MQMARFLPIYQGGAQVLFNAISWTIEDEALTPVRTKTVGSHPIEITSDQTVVVAKTLNLGVLPLAFIGFGLLRWRVRRARRQAKKL